MNEMLTTILGTLIALYLVHCSPTVKPKPVTFCDLGNVKIIREYSPLGWSAESVRLLSQFPNNEIYVIAKYNLKETNDDLFKVIQKENSIDIYYKNDRLPLEKNQKNNSDNIIFNLKYVDLDEFMKLPDCAK